MIRYANDKEENFLETDLEYFSNLIRSYVTHKLMELKDKENKDFSDYILIDGLVNVFKGTNSITYSTCPDLIKNQDQSFNEETIVRGKESLDFFNKCMEEVINAEK